MAQYIYIVSGGDLRSENMLCLTQQAFAMHAAYLHRALETSLCLYIGCVPPAVVNHRRWVCQLFASKYIMSYANILQIAVIINLCNQFCNLLLPVAINLHM